MSTTEPVDADLPKALIKRLIKTKLQEVDVSKGGDGTRDFQVNKDALLAFGEAGKLFIHYITATANDICKDAKRQTISADDVLAALTDLEFEEFIQPLKESLEAFRTETKEKNKKKAELTKKRKSDAVSPPPLTAPPPEETAPDTAITQDEGAKETENNDDAAEPVAT